MRIIGIYERISKASKVLLNSYPNEVYEVGVDKSKPRDCEKVDLYKATPSRVHNTVKNRRFAFTHDAQAQGIILDIMTKTNTRWYITGDSRHIKGWFKVGGAKGTTHRIVFKFANGSSRGISFTNKDIWW